MSIKYKKNINPDGYITTSPLPSLHELQKFYAESYYQEPSSSSYQEKYDDIEIKYKNLKCEVLLYALCEHDSHAGNAFLDIGTGEGFLINLADKKGFQVTGIDFSAYGVTKYFPHLLSNHISDDIFSSLNALAMQKKLFSVCTAINVLEHVLDPNLFLKLLRSILINRGIAAITVPNDYSGIQQLALKEKMIDREFWFNPPHHLHYFNTKNLEKFVEKQGYEILDAYSDFPVDLYLLHTGSNYVMNPACGREANKARMLHDLMIYDEYGLKKYLDYYRAMYKVGLGRDITIIVRAI
jgi:2-polyprenyl-3-methyl-5-hydroxy-6-metoxy-1,4-benzoquinol methylase